MIHGDTIEFNGNHIRSGYIDEPESRQNYTDVDDNPLRCGQPRLILECGSLHSMMLASLVETKRCKAMLFT